MANIRRNVLTQKQPNYTRNYNKAQINIEIFKLNMK